MSSGKRIAMSAAKSIGLGETASTLAGGVAAAGGSVIQAAAKLSPVSKFF